MALLLVSCQTSPKKQAQTGTIMNGQLEKTASVEGIDAYKLPNGLKVLFFPDSSQAKLTVNITYFVGSRHEGYGEAGMAHLLEHMLFKGTPQRPDIWKSLTQRGANFNGTTWTDRTNYYETLPASLENLEYALSLEADRMINSKIDPNDLKKEFSVVRNEFEMGENSPVRVLIERLHSSAFLWHNYGKSTIGNRSDIEKVPVENLRSFYRKYYQPDNAMLVVAGRFDPAVAKKKVEEHFARIPKPHRKLPSTHTTEPQQDGERLVTLRRTGEVGLAGALYHIPQGSHKDFVAVNAISEILLNNPNGILYKTLVKKGIATNIFGYAFSWKEPGTFWAIAEVAPKYNPQKIVKQLTSLIENLKDHDISKKEVERFKKKVLSDFRVSLADSQSIAVELSEWAAMGDWRLMFIYRDRIEKLSTADVRKAYKKYFVPSNRTAAVFMPTANPQRAPLPETANITNLVSHYKGKPPIAAGEAFDPSYANIAARQKISTLSNGTKLAALAKKTRGEVVELQVSIRYGNAKSLFNAQVAEFMLPTLMLRGTKNYSLEQLQDKLVELDAKINGYNIQNGLTTFQISTRKSKLAETIKLFGEILNEPRFDSEEFQIVKKQILTSLRQNLAEPQAIASHELEKTSNPFPKDSIHYVYSIKETIEQVKKSKVNDIKKFFRNQWNPGLSSVAIVGDFDESKIKGQLAKAIGKKKTKVAYKEIVKPFQSSIITSKVVNTPDKKGAMVSVGHNFKLSIDDNMYPSAKIAAFVFGQSANSRLNNRLRQKEGIAYGAWGGFTIPEKGEFSRFTASSICAPENAQKAADILVEETQKLAASGLTQDELDKAKVAYAEWEKNMLADDSKLAKILETGLRSGLTIDFFTKRAAKIKALSLSQVNKNIKAMLQPKKLAKVVAADLSKLKKSASH